MSILLDVLPCAQLTNKELLEIFINKPEKVSKADNQSDSGVESLVEVEVVAESPRIPPRVLFHPPLHRCIWWEPAADRELEEPSSFSASSIVPSAPPVPPVFHLGRRYTGGFQEKG